MCVFWEFGLWNVFAPCLALALVTLSRLSRKRPPDSPQGRGAQGHSGTTMNQAVGWEMHERFSPIRGNALYVHHASNNFMVRVNKDRIPKSGLAATTPWHTSAPGPFPAVSVTHAKARIYKGDILSPCISSCTPVLPTPLLRPIEVAATHSGHPWWRPPMVPPPLRLATFSSSRDLLQQRGPTWTHYCCVVAFPNWCIALEAVVGGRCQGPRGQSTLPPCPL